MTTQIGASVHVDPSQIRHSVTNGTATLTFGPWPTVNRVDVYLGDVTVIDKVIAELVALRNEMTGDLPGCICDIASADQCKVHRRPEATLPPRRYEHCEHCPPGCDDGTLHLNACTTPGCASTAGGVLLAAGCDPDNAPEVMYAADASAS